MSKLLKRTLTEAEWNQALSKYRGCKPNQNNSDFEGLKINLFNGYSGDVRLEDIKAYIDEATKTIWASNYANLVYTTKSDIDAGNKIAFIDIKLFENLTLPELEGFLAFIENQVNL
jgi:hypothetical protein